MALLCHINVQTCFLKVKIKSRYFGQFQIFFLELRGITHRLFTLETHFTAMHDQLKESVLGALARLVMSCLLLTTRKNSIFTQPNQKKHKQTKTLQMNQHRQSSYEYIKLKYVFLIIHLKFNTILTQLYQKNLLFKSKVDFVLPYIYFVLLLTYRCNTISIYFLCLQKLFKQTLSNDYKNINENPLNGWYLPVCSKNRKQDVKKVE